MEFSICPQITVFHATSTVRKQPATAGEIRKPLPLKLPYVATVTVSKKCLNHFLLQMEVQETPTGHPATLVTSSVNSPNTSHLHSTMTDPTDPFKCDYTLCTKANIYSSSSCSFAYFSLLFSWVSRVHP